MKKIQGSDLLTDSTLALAMGALSSRFAVHTHVSIDSTNAEAKRLALSGERYAVVAAEGQTAGRGRMGRSFFSPEQAGAYFSILYTYTAPLAQAVAVTSAAAVAVMRAIARLCGIQTEIKWVNDLYRDGKKVCGILAESLPLSDGSYAVVVGIGINLRGEFSGELADIACSLQTDVAKDRLIAAVLEELLPFFDDPCDHAWIADYKRCSMVLGRDIAWWRDGIMQEGRAIDIDGDGALLAETEDGEHVRLATGEITLRVK